jgi:NAD-dependent dihydropyrimidine dehydrogenase PreA subunit
MTRLVDSDTCTGCGDCLDVCPVEAIQLEDGKAVIDPETCIDCGVCDPECPVDAISAPTE